MYFVRVPIHYTIYWQSVVQAFIYRKCTDSSQAVSGQITHRIPAIYRQYSVYMQSATLRVEQKFAGSCSLQIFFTSVCRQFTDSLQPVDISRGSLHASTGCPQTLFLIPSCLYRGGQANFFFKVRKSQIHKFLGSFRYRKSAKSIHLRTWESFESENHNKHWVCKSLFHKVPHLRKVRKSNEIFTVSQQILKICGPPTLLQGLLKMKLSSGKLQIWE